MGQLATQMNVLTRGSLPSDTIPNPRNKGKEECKVITLRSGKRVDNESKPQGVNKESQSDIVFDEKAKVDENILVDENVSAKKNVVESKDKVQHKDGGDDKAKPYEAKPKYVSPPPFPQRLKKYQDDGQFKKFLEMFKQLHINIPFAEALEQMPKYAKFLKDVLSKKRRFSEFETVALTEDCSAILQRKLPPKLKDPGSFNIPCNIGNNFKGKALCDLGASVNLMPSAVFNRLG